MVLSALEALCVYTCTLSHVSWLESWFIYFNQQSAFLLCINVHKTICVIEMSPYKMEFGMEGFQQQGLHVNISVLVAFRSPSVASLLHLYPWNVSISFLFICKKQRPREIRSRKGERTQSGRRAHIGLRGLEPVWLGDNGQQESKLLVQGLRSYWLGPSVHILSTLSWNTYFLWFVSFPGTPQTAKAASSVQDLCTPTFTTD